jgi:hypothetical protein
MGDFTLGNGNAVTRPSFQGYAYCTALHCTNQLPADAVDHGWPTRLLKLYVVSVNTISGATVAAVQRIDTPRVQKSVLWQGSFNMAKIRSHSGVHPFVYNFHLLLPCTRGTV